MSREIKKEEKSAETTELGSPKTPKDLWRWKLEEDASKFKASMFALDKSLGKNLEDASPAMENNGASFK